MSEIDVYRVGLWADVHHQGFRLGGRRSWRYAKLQARQRNWRAIKNTLNGFLAEPIHDVPGLTHCGHGWTRRRALRSLDRYLAVAASVSGTSDTDGGRDE